MTGLQEEQVSDLVKNLGFTGDKASQVTLSHQYFSSYVGRPVLVVDWRKIKSIFYGNL